MDNKNPKDPPVQSHKEIIRAGGKLREIFTIYDVAGNILHKVTSPLNFEFKTKDVVQIIVGSTLLAVPVAFTEEVWQLGADLPNQNIVLIGLMSVFFIGIFVFYNFYRGHFFAQWQEFLKRSIALYIIAFIMSGLILTLIDKAPWSTDYIVALKRIVIVTFPASMSAAVANMLT